MFAETKAFSGFAVDDLETARAFYGETLGLSTSAERDLLDEGPPIAWLKDPAGNILAVLEL